MHTNIDTLKEKQDTKKKDQEEGIKEVVTIPVKSVLLIPIEMNC